jgi:hypothetical protein
MVKTVGAGGRLSLGRNYEGRRFEIEVQADGGILLKPVPSASQPDDTWLEDPVLRERLRAAEAWMDANPPRESELDALLERRMSKA